MLVLMNALITENALMVSAYAIKGLLEQIARKILARITALITELVIKLSINVIANQVSQAMTALTKNALMIVINSEYAK